MTMNVFQNLMLMANVMTQVIILPMHIVALQILLLFLTQRFIPCHSNVPYKGVNFLKLVIEMDYNIYSLFE